MSWFSRCSWCGGPFNGENCWRCTNVSFGDEFVHDPNPLPYDNTPDFSYQPPQHHVETYSCELCGNDSHYGYDCPPRFPLVYEQGPVEDLNPIPSESEDTYRSDSECDLSSCENNSMSGNPTPSSDFEVESLSPPPIPYEDSNPLLEETDILLSHFDDSLPKYETFSFDIEEKSSGSTTTYSDYSLPDYEAFYFEDDHIEEKSSGNTTTHSDFSLPEYDLFIFDLSIDPFPPVDRSVSHHEEFADELTHIISSPEIALDFEDSCARGFVLHSLELQSLAYGNLIS
nr:hypothetical protein [Tanacetum cinerariifolium]